MLLKKVSFGVACALSLANARHVQAQVIASANYLSTSELIAGIPPELVALNDKKKEAERVALLEQEKKNAAVALAAPQYVFNTNFLRGKNSKVDMGDLLGSGVLPGNYQVSIYLNNGLKLRKDMVFAKNARTGAIEACITADTLRALRIDVDALLDGRHPDAQNPQACLDLPLLNPQARQTYEPGQFRLKLSIPQIFLLPDAEEYVDPALWDYGVSAAFVNYNMALSNNSSTGGAGTRRALASNFSNGINLFGWRYRNTSSLYGSNSEKFKFSSFTNYVEHDVDYLKAQVRLGDVFASSRLLDSVGIRGIQLSDDLSMQPGSDSVHRPIVRGVAETNATVEVRQLGFLLYTAKVPPGPFELTDINPAGATGDLEVKVIEADGRERVTILPWGTSAYMVKKGFFTYDLAVGQYKQYNQRNVSMNVANFDYTYGLAENLSILGGIQLADNYRGIGLGIGTNTPIGPISIDIQNSSSKTEQGTRTGNSVRFSYSKSFLNTGTSFAFASQRYSTEGFRSLTTHAQYLDTAPGSLHAATPKIATSLSVSQSLRDYGLGSVYLSVSDNQYWDSTGRSTSVSAGYSNNWRKMSYSLSFSQSRNLASRGIESRNDTSFGLTVSIPLGSNVNPTSVSASVNSSSNGPTTQTASLSSSFDMMGQPSNYNLYGSGQEGNFDSFGASMTTRTPFVGYTLNGSTGKSYTSYGANIGGGMLLHAGGVNFSSGMNETMILANVGGQPDVEVNYSARTGSNGYAIIAGASPYRINQVLVGKNLPSDVDLVDGSGVSVVPRRGAIVRANFDVKSGRRIEFTVFKPDGQKAPFGTYLYDDNDHRIGVTDPFGKALVLVEQDKGNIHVKWDNESCIAPYSLGKKNEDLYYEKEHLVCENGVRIVKE